MIAIKIRIIRIDNMAICFHLLQVLAQSEKYNSIRF